MLTQEIINRDFETWADRLQTAKTKLSKLPTGWLPTYRERKKCKDLQRKYESEIKHVNGLFRIAAEGTSIHGFKVPVIGGND